MANDASSPRSRRRVAVVIGSGSVKCAASLGLINVLRRRGIDIDMLVGCSAGCLYATLIASGRSVDEAADITRRLWTSDIAARRDRMSMLRALLPRVLGFDASFGLRDDALMMKRLRQAFGDERIEGMQIPLHLAATDFANGNQVVFSSGSVIDAIRASMALPFMFSPWRIDGKLYVDGYMSDPLPVGVAIKEGADIIVAMGFESPYQERISTPGRFAFQVSSILSNNLLKSQFSFHGLAHHAEVIPILPEFRQRIRLFDTEKIPAIIEDGERAAEQQMPYLLRLLDAEARSPEPFG